VDFKLLFNCAGVSDGTKTSMWKYLQLLLFTVLGSVKDTTNFGDTLDMFESMNETDLQDKMKETMAGLEDFFKGMGSDSNYSEEQDDTTSSSSEHGSLPSEHGSLPSDQGPLPKGFKLPKPEIIQEHMKILMEGKLGKLAKELTEEFTGDLKDVFDENEDTKDKSIKEIMAQLMKDPKKLMGIMKKITDKLQNKMQSGDISQDELMKEVATLVEKFKEMGGGDDFIKNFTNGPFAKMFKNMAAGAGLNANTVAQMGKQSAMKERLRKKMEERKMREALASASETPSLTPANKNIVVKIGDEKQEKSGLRPPLQSGPPLQSSNALNEAELIALFKNDKPKKKKAKK
jgi:hypothetical protein